MEKCEKIEDSSDFDSELIIVLNEPRIYSKSNMYLKARIHRLTEADLQDYTKDELAYLRNEIFARHGHLFKTPKNDPILFPSRLVRTFL